MERPAQRKNTGRSIILIGMMGCGKTTVGKELSRVTGMPLLDMDAVIEEQRGKSIPEIFKTEGEACFRALETALLQYMVSSEGSHASAIVSTGGGVVGRAENRALLRRLGFVVWLDVDIQTLVSRTGRASNRPLLKNPSRREVLAKLLEERAPLYADTAHRVVSGVRKEVSAIVEEVKRAAEEFFRSPDAAGGCMPE